MKYKTLKQDVCVIDLKLTLYFGHSFVLAAKQGVINEQRQNNLFTNHGFSADSRISQVCSALPW